MVPEFIDPDQSGHAENALGFQDIVSTLELDDDLGYYRDPIEEILDREEEQFAARPSHAPVPPLSATDSLEETQWTDSSVAERWAARVANEWCWTSAAGFMTWGGRGWKVASDSQALESVRRFAKREVMENLDAGKEELKSAIKRLEAGALRAALSLTKGQMVRDLAEFDQDPDIAVAENGVIDLRTGELLPHDSSRLMTKSCGAAYVPGATHPDFDAVLTSVPPEVADYLQLRFGQALTGHRPDDDVMMSFRGGGENAKSTLIDAVDAAFGDYSVLISDKVLLGDQRDHSTELMDLRGARWAYIEELPEARYLNLARLKKIDGSKKVKARYVHKDNIEFPQTWALTVSSNYEILVGEVDRGTWRRLKEIRFPYTYKKAHEPLVEPTDRRGDPRLREAITGEAQQQAVLAWLVEGARRWYADGRKMQSPPAQVEADTTNWRKRNDLVLDFVEDNMIVDPDGVVLVTDLAEVFNEWLLSRGHKKWSASTLRSRIEENGWLRDSGVRLTGRERRDPARLSRPERPEGNKAAPVMGQYLVGVRFRTRVDDTIAVQEMRRSAQSADLAARQQAQADLMADTAPFTASQEQQVQSAAPAPATSPSPRPNVTYPVENESMAEMIARLTAENEEMRAAVLPKPYGSTSKTPDTHDNTKENTDD